MMGAPKYVSNPEPVRGGLEGCAVSVQPLLAGGDYVTAWKAAKTSPARSIWVLSVANATPYGNATRTAVSSVNQALALGLDQVEAQHRQWWHQFYPASFISIPDARLESFYWLQLYKMASATRADRVVLDLMGPWYKNSNFPCLWMDLNLQLSYYPQYAANHLDLGESLFRLLDRDLPNLIENAPAEFRSDSAFLGGVSDLSLKGNLVHMLYHPDGCLDLIALPWCAHNYFMHYRFSMDDDLLRWRVYPLLRRAINLYVHYLEPGLDGKYHLPLTRSCEYGCDHDTNQDLALLRWGCGALIYSCERLKLDDPDLPRWRDILARLVNYPTDENGLRIGRDEPFRRPHRHYSHLLAIFPLYNLNLDQPEHVGLIRKSVVHWIGAKGDPAHSGYTYTGSASMFASLGEGELACEHLNFCLDHYIEANTMYIESSSPTMETPLAAARSLQDLLIQSWGGKIRVFPAVPRTWREVAIHNLRAEGAFLISAVRKEGRTQFVRVTSLAGEPCRLQTDLPDPIHTLGSRPGMVRRMSTDLLELNLYKAETVAIYSGETVPDLTILPVATPQAKWNAYGLKNKAK
jgi:alpha-L-fucosidase 2